MNGQKLLFQQLERITGLFIFISMLTVCSVLIFHLYKTEKMKTVQVQESVEEYFLQNSSDISEEMYFDLREAVSLREDYLQSVINSKGLLSITIEKNLGVSSAALNWIETSVQESVLNVPVFFGSEYQGSLKVSIHWNSSVNLLSVAREIYVWIGLSIVFCLLLWFVVFGLLKQRYISPLLESALDREKKIATTETARMLAHDAKRPFNLLYSFLQSLEYASNLNEVKDRIERTLPIARKASDSLHEIIDSTMKSSVKSQVNLNEVHEIALSNIEISVGKRSADIRTDFECLEVPGDRSDFVRVFQNIVQNAVEATSEGDQIHIGSEKVTSGVRLTFRNSGPEISKEIRNQLFQSGTTTKKARLSRGEGMASVKRIVEAHNGEISVSSENNITEFKIVFPHCKEEYLA